MKSKFPIARKQFALFLFLLSASFSHAQKLKAGRWEVYGSATQFNYSRGAPHYGVGIMADYYLTKNFCVRSGITANSDYLSVSTAPVFWALLTSEPSKTHHSDHWMKGSLSSNLKVFAILLLLSDGFSYSIKASKNLYVCPYLAPLQYKEFFPTHTTDLNLSLLTSSIGVGVKKYFHNKLVLYAGAEVSSGALYKGSGWGYRFNVSAGWVIRHK